MTSKPHLTLAALLLACASTVALAEESAKDKAALGIANNAGCMTCHHVDPGAKGPNGLPPIGPPWRDVAAKYKGQKGALEQLTHTVMTGSNPYESHWKGKASGLAMPPNAAAIKEADARKLVKWILALEPAKAS
ncbi:c-type cytochrome [Aquabacterium sp.]|jgi:cytochrome c|uniref:c-type cytochrome n=1 Tax=Aquabacterium sp. TaxID=1872578 RepID=UPI0025BCA271|nr:c-type cytochrome [Aquabacterium sp.]